MISNSQNSNDGPARRIVLLGASNLTLAFPTAVSVLRDASAVPLDVMAALGHGRSYGMTTQILGRRLPGITPCGLWNDLESRPALPTRALITDVGNDMLYGAPVPEIAAWLDECVERLSALGAEVAITALPMENLPRITPWHFRLLKAVFFPRSTLTYEQGIERSKQIQAHLERLAAERGVQLLPQRPEWYGIDPIHHRRRLRPQVWQEFLAPLVDQPINGRLSRAPGVVRPWRLIPHRRWLFGVERIKPQPVVQLDDGTHISVY